MVPVFLALGESVFVAFTGDFALVVLGERVAVLATDAFLTLALVDEAFFTGVFVVVVVLLGLGMRVTGVLVG